MKEAETAGAQSSKCEPNVKLTKKKRGWGIENKERNSLVK